MTKPGDPEYPHDNPLTSDGPYDSPQRGGERYQPRDEPHEPFNPPRAIPPRNPDPAYQNPSTVREHPPLFDPPYRQRPEPMTPTTVEAKRAALVHGDPVLPPLGPRPVAKDLDHPTTAELKAQADWDARSADADAVLARTAARGALVYDDRLFTLMHNIDGRTTTIARGMEHDASVLEQLRAQLQLDARDLRTVTPLQLEVISVAVARIRAFAAQLVSLCASRDVPLPIAPTVPTPPSVPPARA